MYNILIVEDDYPMRTLLVDILEKWKISSKLKHLKIFCSATAKEALKIALDIRIDLFIIDIGLPDLDGIDLSRKIRVHKGEHTYRHTPIIIESQNSDPLKQIEVLDQVQNSAYLVKPFSGDELIKKVSIFVDIEKELEEEKKVCLILGKGRTTRAFELDEIIYIEKIKDTKNVNVIIKNNQDPIKVTRTNLEDVLRKVEEGLLLQSQNSYIVNPNDIKEIDYDNDEIYLKNSNQIIPIGYRFKTAFEKNYERYKEQRL